MVEPETPPISYNDGLAANASGYGTWDINYKNGKGINQWDHFVKTVDNALSDTDVDGDGIKDKLIPSGIIWMQGESDAIHPASARAYMDNLSHIISQISKTLGQDKLPTVICRIEDFGQKKRDRLMPHIETVWAVQEAFARSNKHVSYIKLSPPVEFLDDKWHYKSKHYLEMGTLFAQAIYDLDKKP